MKRRAWRGLAWLVLLAVWIPAVSAGFFPYPHTVDDFPNGLRLITVLTDHPRLVALYLVVQTGSRNEVEPGRSGFAHWKRGNYAPVIPPEPAQTGPRQKHIDWPSPALPQIVIAFPGPAYAEYFPQGMFRSQPEPNLGRQQQIFQIWIRPVEPSKAVFALQAALYEYDKLTPSPITYNSPKPTEILEEDKIISVYSLKLKPGKVTIRPVDQVFE